ncbi:MAG: hypothetical protein ACYSWO_16325 [Planctomycetota bacterium]|jgi:hypothetical protein
MKEDENILEKAIEAIKNERIPAGPPQELVDATVTKLTEAQEQPGTLPFGGVEKPGTLRGITRLAAAAALFVVAGYVVGRLSAPRPPEVEELRAVLEPAIRRDLLAELKRDFQSDLAADYAQLRDDLTEQYRRDLNQFAAYTLTASGAATNRLLEELIESISTAQTQERQWVTSAFEQLESNRLRDNARLSNAFAAFAVRTEDELELTKQGVAQLLSYVPRDDSVSDR